MRTIFAHTPYNEQLHKQGYVIINLLAPDEVMAMQALYVQYDEDLPDRFYCSNYILDPQKRNEESNAITRYLFPKLQPYLNKYQPLFGAFITKRTGTKGKVHPHQDWQFVDETKYTDLNVWVALNNLHPLNGALSVYPGSHRLHTKLRGPNLDYNPQPTELAPYSKKTLYLKAGQAVIYPTALVHTSTGNYSLQKRIAVNMIVIPEAAMPVYVFKDKTTSEVTIYNVPVDFYIKHCIFKPTGAGWELNGQLK